MDSMDLLPPHSYDITHIEEQDFIIAGYPKSGNTWLQNICSCLLFGMSGEFLPDRLVQDLVPDVHYKTSYKRYRNQMGFKSHLGPQPEYRNVIHLIRDPRDVYVSLKYYLDALGLKFSLLEIIKESKGVNYSWGYHTSSWLKNEYDANLIVLRFEDLLNNPYDTISKLCDFLKIRRSASFLHTVIRWNSFEKLREKEVKWGLDNINWNHEKNFFRRGKVGNPELSEYLNEMIKERFGAHMQIFDYQ